MRKAGWMVTAAAMMMCSLGALKGYALAGADAPLAPGTTAPGFSLPSQTDSMVSLKDYKGKYVVLYFYPKDMTTGCTIEAHNFERDKDKYAALNAVVLGVSLDTVESHKTFCTKDSLTFKLLADPEGKVVAEYGVPVMARGETKFAMRQTYLIGPDGKVLKFWDVKDVQGHSADVLASIETMKK